MTGPEPLVKLEELQIPTAKLWIDLEEKLWSFWIVLNLILKHNKFNAKISQKFKIEIAEKCLIMIRRN